MTRLDPTRTAVHSTFFGGSDFDYGWGIAVDGAGRAHAVGSTRSPDLPLATRAVRARRVDDAFLLPIGDILVPATLATASWSFLIPACR